MKVMLLTSLALALASMPGRSLAATPGLQRQIPAAEYAALVDLYTSTNGESWRDSTGWLDPEAPFWAGVRVFGFSYDPAYDEVLHEGNVFFLWLGSNQLSGSLPESLGNLEALIWLELGWNQLSGPIPASLAHLSMGILDLSRNQLSGNIPEGLGSEWMSLSENELSGSLPNSFRGVRWLSLRDNQLSGSIPESYIHLPLESLDLSFNQLSGDLPNFALRQIPWGHPLALRIDHNCFDISPGSQARTMINSFPYAPGEDVVTFYKPQNPGCGSAAWGDLNNDGCVDRADLAEVANRVRVNSDDLTYDLNRDGLVNIADARFLTLHFTNPGGSPCLQ